MVGLLLLLGLLLFVVVGSFLVDVERARPLSARALQPPGGTLPFGSDKQGRDLFAVMVAGAPLTLRIGLIAGIIGTFVGATLAFFSAYYGGEGATLLPGSCCLRFSVPRAVGRILVAVNFPGWVAIHQVA